MADPGRTTRLLRKMTGGDTSAAEELLPIIYDELHRVAEKLMAGERRDHTLQPTALIHEAWVRLSGADCTFDDRAHFLRVAARAMRRALVDHARKKKASKRGDGQAPLPLDHAQVAWEQPVDLLELEEALERLGENDDQLLRIVELRFFGGLTHEEAGQALGLTERQVRLGWTSARGWLRRELERQGG